MSLSVCQRSFVGSPTVSTVPVVRLLSDRHLGLYCRPAIHYSPTRLACWPAIVLLMKIEVRSKPKTFSAILVLLIAENPRCRSSEFVLNFFSGFSRGCGRLDQEQKGIKTVSEKPENGFWKKRRISRGSGVVVPSGITIKTTKPGSLFSGLTMFDFLTAFC